MDSSAPSGAGGVVGAFNPRVWIVAGIAVVGVIVLAEAAWRRRRWLRGKSSAPPDSGAFCDRLELAPPRSHRLPLCATASRCAPPTLKPQLRRQRQIEGYVAGFGNPDWKRMQKAASRTARWP